MYLWIYPCKDLFRTYKLHQIDNSAFRLRTFKDDRRLQDYRIRAFTSGRKRVLGEDSDASYHQGTVLIAIPRIVTLLMLLNKM